MPSCTPSNYASSAPALPPGRVLHLLDSTTGSKFELIPTGRVMQPPLEPYQPYPPDQAIAYADAFPPASPLRYRRTVAGSARRSSTPGRRDHGPSTDDKHQQRNRNYKKPADD
eukprot:GHVT01098890.1.p1 GENE.GHVT01098890.1~~GHVT01098890.1.p1  ORF type:complete len:113 (-),score=17.13 GHVT01098890.1:104-442(-)